MTTLAFGRRNDPDDRDLKYLMRRRLAAPSAVQLPSRKTWRLSSHSLDQGQTGTCVGHGWKNWLRCEPMRTEKGGPSQWDIYRAAVLLDPWGDNDDEAHHEDGNPHMDSGTSIRAGAEAVLATGRLKSYLWAFELAPVIEWVLTQGPVVLGINWYSSFMNPGADGIIKITPTARSVGGHAILMRGLDMRRSLATLENSWGDAWGNGGACYLPLGDLERLIHEDGECCSAIEQKLKPKDIT